MMSSGHAGTGALGGYTACLTYSLLTGHEWSWWFPHLVAIVVAGWALWCDCDTLKSTVSTSLGWITQRVVHPAVCIVCAWVYYATRTEADPADKPKIHRGATHTWPAAVFVGALVAALCALWPRYATPAILALSLHWGLRGLAIPTAPHGKPKGSFLGRFIAHRAYVFNRLIPQPGRVFNWAVRKVSRAMGFSGKWVRTSSVIVCSIAAWLITENTPEVRTGWVIALGGCVTLGCLIHMAGDSVTESGICWKFPFTDKATGKRWQETKIPSITAPHWVPFLAGRVYKPAFKTGWWFELAFVYPLCFAGCLIAAPGGYDLLVSLTNILTAWRRASLAAAALPFPPWPTTPPSPPAPGAPTPVAVMLLPR